MKSHRGYLTNRGIDPDDLHASCALLAWALQRDSLTPEERDALTDDEWKIANGALTKLDRGAMPAIINGPPAAPDQSVDEDETGGLSASEALELASA